MTDSLELRVARLERNNKMLLVFIGLSLAAIAYLAGRSADTVRARAIELVGPQGNVLGELAVRDGNPGLYLKDSDARDRVALFHSPEASGLYINDAQETTRIGVAQFDHGGGGVALHGPGSRGAAVLYYKGEGSLRFFNADGELTNLVPARDAAAESAGRQ